MGNHAATVPVADQAEPAPHGAERGFAKLDFELNDYPGAVKASLFGIQHVLVMFTAMVGGPLIVGRLLNLPEGTRIAMVSGTMIGCGIATMISALGMGFVRALSLFVTMIIGYLVSAWFGLIDLGTVTRADWVTVPMPFPYGGLQWPGLIAVITVVICFFATAVETTGHTLAVSRICGVPAEGWRIRGAVSNDGLGSALSAMFGGMALTSYSQNIGVISLTGVGSRFVVAFGGAFLILDR